MKNSNKPANAIDSMNLLNPENTLNLMIEAMRVEHAITNKTASETIDFVRVKAAALASKDYLFYLQLLKQEIKYHLDGGRYFEGLRIGKQVRDEFPNDPAASTLFRATIARVSSELISLALKDPMNSEIGAIYEELIQLEHVPDRSHLLVAHHFGRTNQPIKAVELLKKIRAAFPGQIGLESEWRICTQAVDARSATNGNQTLGFHELESERKRQGLEDKYRQAVGGLDNGQKPSPRNTKLINDITLWLQSDEFPEAHRIHFLLFKAMAYEFSQRSHEAMQVVSELLKMSTSPEVLKLYYAVYQKLVSAAVALTLKEVNETQLAIHFERLQLYEGCPWPVRLSYAQELAKAKKSVSVKAVLEPILALNPGCVEYHREALGVAATLGYVDWRKDLVRRLREICHNQCVADEFAA